jgi:hypothetical protein
MTGQLPCLADAESIKQDPTLLRIQKADINHQLYLKQWLNVKKLAKRREILCK